MQAKRLDFSRLALTHRTGKQVLLALLVLATMTAPLRAEKVRVDIGPEGQRAPDGWVQWDMETGVIDQQIALTADFDEDFTAVLTGIDSGNWRDRTDLDIPLGEVLEDFAFSSMWPSIRFDDLDAGEYIFRLHSNEEARSGEPILIFDVVLFDADQPAGETVRTSVTVGNSTQRHLAHQVVIPFRADGANPVEVVFMVVNEYVTLNGFSLGPAGEPEPWLLLEPVMADWGPIDLGFVPIGEFDSTTLTLTNIGDPDSVLSLQNPLFGPGQGDDWSLASDPGSYPFEMAPGDTTELVVDYTPQFPGQSEAHLLVSTNDPIVPLTTVTLRAQSGNYAYGFVPGVTATASANANLASRLVDDSLLRESPMRHIVGTRNAGRYTLTDPNTFWNSDDRPDEVDVWVEFDLGDVRAIGDMVVWNYCYYSYSQRSVTEIRVGYSQDGETWETLGTYEIPQGMGLQWEEPHAVIDFDGAELRYVHLDLLGTYDTMATGVSAPANVVGLGTVRFYEYGAPILHLEPSPHIEFGIQRSFSHSEIELTVGNLGPEGSTIDVTAIAFTDAPGPFTISDLPVLPKSYGSGETDQILVSFDPQEFGEFSAPLQVDTASGGVPNTGALELHGQSVVFERGFIRNVDCYAQSEYPPNYLAVKLVDGSGITEIPEDGFHIGMKAALHDNFKSNMWHNDTGPAAGGLPMTEQWVEFDLGKVFDLDEAWIWNYNRGDCCLDRGLKNTTVNYRTEESEEWQTLGTVEFAQGSGENDQPATNLTDGSPLEFGGVAARYVRFVPAGGPGEGNYGGGDSLAMSEVRFYTASFPTLETATAVDLGTHPAGDAVSAELTVLNTGTGTLYIDSAVMQQDGSPFSVVTEPLPSILAGESGVIEVKMDGSEVGFHTGTLRIGSNDDVSPFVFVSLSGNVYAENSPDIHPASMTLDFGSVGVGLPAPVLDLEIRNLGDTELIVSDVVLTGDTGIFSFDVVIPLSVPPFSSAALPVVCAPPETGDFSAVLALTSNDPDEGTLDITLHAAGVIPPDASAEGGWRLYR